MNSSNKSRNLFVAVSLAALSVGAAIFLIQAFRSINVQQDIQYPESAVVFGVVNLWRGGTLYHDFHNPPFAITSYPPVFYVISATVAKLFARSVHSGYVCSRAVAFGATILTAIFAGILTGRAKGGRVAQFGSAMLFLGSSLLLPWGFIARVDSLMLLFTAIGLYLFIRFRESNLQYLAVIAFVLAIFTKQSALAAPGAVIVVLAFQQKWKQGLIFSAALVLLTAACFLAGNYFTNGLLALNVVGGIAAPIRWQSVVEVFRNSFSGLFLPLVLTVLAVAARLRGRSTVNKLAETEPVAVLFAFYLFGSLALAAFSSTKLGSDRNYYLDSLMAASVLGGLGIEWLADQSQRASSYAILALCLVVLVGLPDLSQKYRIMTSDYYVSEDNSSTIESLRSMSGDILTQDANIALRLDKPVFVTDSYHLWVMISTGRWKPDPLSSLIAQKHFHAIVLPFDIVAAQRPDWATYQGLAIWDARILNAINDNYRLAEQHGGFYTYCER